MAEQVIRSTDTEETLAIGRTLGEQLAPGSIISLRGSLGAGKTIIAKGIASALKIDEAITSPTYTLLQEYQGTLPLYHMDLYRIDSVDEFEMLGTEELLYGNGITLIEWSEKIDEILPEDTIFITLTIEENQDRIITIQELIMNILAFDTSADYLNIALKTDNAFYEVNHQVGLKHSEHLLPQIEQLLKLAQIDMENLDLIICARGPGSFTGLRIGFSTAKGLAAGAGIPLVSVPSLDIYASNCQHTNSITIPVIDARKRRFYAALFEDGKKISEDLDASSIDLINSCPTGTQLIITGPDAPKFLAEAEAPIVETLLDEGYNRGHGRRMIDLGLKQFQDHGADSPDQGPTYIRKSEAELSREKGLLK